MKLFHGRWREAAALLAAGALSGKAEAEAEAHLRGCVSCTADHAAFRRLLMEAEADPVRTAEPPIPQGALLARVRARLAEDARAPERSPVAGWRFSSRPALLAAGALLAAALAVVALRDPGTERPGQGVVAEAPAAAPRVPDPPMISDEALARLDRTLVRERTARYLSEAEDVLVTVAASPHRCRREHGRVDMAEEAERSRELLARRSMLELDADAVASARPVLDDVEQVLREVAALESCARPDALLAIHRSLTRSRLLMKIDLMTRELQG